MRHAFLLANCEVILHMMPFLREPETLLHGAGHRKLGGPTGFRGMSKNVGRLDFLVQL